jgi:5-(carboxyamino)imidazole ribonucleotide synthase
MKNAFFSTSKKLGILGGGQLGKMLLTVTQQWDIYTKVLDPDKNSSCKIACNEFVLGSFKDYDTVYNFGKYCDVVTVEIEHVNTDALLQLEKEGKKVHPSPSALNIIKDKGLQKQFYEQHQLPTSPFFLIEHKKELLDKLNENKISFPFVQKTRTAGYDGKGVQVVKTENDIWDLPSVIENLISIEKEIAVIASRNEDGEIQLFDAVLMQVHEQANMLDTLICPAPIEKEVAEQAKKIASILIEKFNICGLLAVEFFIDTNQNVIINEVAPRPHNSGHHSIEACVTSQFEQHIRGVLNLPLGNTAIITPSVMINILGKDGFEGNVNYEGIADCMKLKNCFIHLYGKKTTKPFRKMGHATIINKDINEAIKTAQWIKNQLQVKSV